MERLTQQQLNQLAIQGIDRRINEWNVIYQTKGNETKKRQAFKQINAYQNVKKSLLVD